MVHSFVVHNYVVFCLMGMFMGFTILAYLLHFYPALCR